MNLWWCIGASLTALALGYAWGSSVWRALAYWHAADLLKVRAAGLRGRGYREVAAQLEIVATDVARLTNRKRRQRLTGEGQRARP